MRLLASTLLLCALAPPAGATDFWVANGGNDANDGLTAATAWETLNHAADVVNPGDAVRVLDGSYQGFDLRRSGTPSNPITFRAEGFDARIIADNGTTPDGINVENAAHVVIDGFIVEGRTRAGIRVAVAQFVTVRNCITTTNGVWGIFSSFADDLTIEDNRVFRSLNEHGIYVSNSGDRPIIRRNVVFDNYGNGIQMNGDLSQGGDGVISNALVERNQIFRNGAGGSGIDMDGVSDSVVRNNLLYDNHASGISLYRIDGGTGSRNNLVINNTVVNADDGHWAVNISNDSTGNTVLNNVLYSYQSFRGAIAVDASSRPGLVSDYNALEDRFSTNGGTSGIDFAAWQALGYDAHSFVATPADLFLVEGNDYRLRADGPAVDAGTATGAPSEDFAGDPRPVGTGVDIGAFEHQLVECGDGNVDPGEECGEPGLACDADPCITCSQCLCTLAPPVCGDGYVCGAEQCENYEPRCGLDRICQDCTCVDAPVCASGIPLRRLWVGLRASPYWLRLRAEALIPKPWTGIDPPGIGVRIVVVALSGPGAGGIDVQVPSGAFWSTSADGLRWTYRDPEGAYGGITRLVITDRSRREDGLVLVQAMGKGGAIAVPPPDAVRASIVLGGSGSLECAETVFGPPGGLRPRCIGDANRLSCR